MKNNDLDKLFDIRNFNIKKSNMHNNRFWKKETVKKVKQLIKDDLKNDFISVDSFNNKRGKKKNGK